MYSEAMDACKRSRHMDTTFFDVIQNGQPQKVDNKVMPLACRDARQNEGLA